MSSDSVSLSISIITVHPIQAASVEQVERMSGQLEAEPEYIG
jgi:hypothetical protein